MAVAQSRMPAQRLRDWHAPAQKLRSNRFLARRGIGARRGIAENAAEMLAEARAQHEMMVAQRDASSGATSLTGPWQPVGPAQVMTSAFGAVTGRVSSIAVDPSDPTGNTVYVGTTGGGIWKAVNGAGNASAVTFTPLTDTLSAYAGADRASLSIGALTVQPGGTGVILAGTGDPNDATDSYYGSGILRSANGGLTWSLISTSSDALIGGKTNFNLAGNGFAGFAWSTTNPGLVVAAISQAAEGVEVNAGSANTVMGLYYSPDAGQTWYMASISDGTGIVVQSNQTVFTTNGNAATAVVWNPMRQMFYAAVRFHGYYQSPDGINWTRLANQPGSSLTTAYCPPNTGSTGSPACPIFRGSLAVQPVTGDLFALTTDINNLDQGLWQDVCGLTAGACSSPTVTFANQIADVALEAGNGDMTIPQADYDLYLAAVPSQQDTLLFAGTEDIYKCSLANSCAWRNTTNATGCASAQVAWAQHAIDTTLGQQGLMYFGNDGGLWRTTDAVNQQQPVCSPDDATHYQNLNGGLGSLAEFEDLANDATNPANMMVSLGGLGTAAATSSATTGATGAWPQVLDGEGDYSAIDPAVEANWYATSIFGVSINRCMEGSGCNEAGFTPAIGSTQVGGDGDQQTIPAPWILDPQDTANVIVGTCRVWRGAATGGSAWTSANLLSGMLDGDPGPYCDGNAEIRSLAASGSASDAPGTPEQIYAGMAGLLDGGATVPGHIFTASVTNASGATTPWVDLFHRPVANGGSADGQFNPGGFDISSIYVDPHDPTGQTVYATVQGFTGNGITEAKVYGSTNGGAVWENLTTNLPNAPANSIVIDPNDANTAYLAMDTGVYITRNVTSCQNPSISCWSPFGTSLPNAPVIQLTAENQESTSVLRAATYGRGVWQIPLVTAGTAMTTAKANPASRSFSSQQVNTQSATQTVAVVNTGTITLNPTQVGITGDFAETDDCVGNAVLPGAACTVNVTFTPSQTGQRTGVLTVYGTISGGAASGQVTVSLSGTAVAGPAVVLTPGSLSFSQTLLGKMAPAQNVTISNTGGVATVLTSESVTGNFSITANTCGTSLPANTGCTLSIAFSPTASGKQTGTLTVVDGAGVQTAQLSGVGESPATDSLAPLNLTFAAQPIGTASLAQQVTLTNNGDQALDLIATQVSGDFNAVNQCGASLSGHSSCAIAVNFVPTQVGAETGTLIVGDALRSQTVTLTGTGVAPAGISVAPASLNFGNFAVGQTSAALPVTLTNNGGAALSAVTFAVTGDFAAQAAPANGCGTTLAVGASCQIAVTFSPQQAGKSTGTMTVSAAQLKAPLTVALSGNGEDFALQVSGSSSAVITSGQTATFMISILPVNGSTGPVALACTGAPQNATCAVNPASVTLTGQNSDSATVTIATGLSSSSAAAQDRGRMGAGGLRLTLAVAFPMGLVVTRRRRKNSTGAKRGARAGFGVLVVLGLLGLLVPLGCNLSVTPGKQGSGGTSAPGSPGNPTPSGAYTLTVTGTAPGLTHTTTLTVTVE